jgi:hypothetical protein
MEQRPYNHPVTPANKPVTAGDSLFGMTLAQAFMGVVYGPCASMLWEAGEIASAVYEDRRGNDSGNFFLGVKNSLAGAFARASEQTVAEFERAFFRPFQPAYAPAFSKI